MSKMSIIYLDQSKYYCENLSLFLEEIKIHKDENRYYCSLRFNNYCEKPITEITLRINQKDINGNPIDPSLVIIEQFVGNDQSKLCIADHELSDSRISSIFPEILSVKYADGTEVNVQTLGEMALEKISLPNIAKIDSVMTSDELVNYANFLGLTPSQIFISPRKIFNLWQCTCGAYNRENDEACRACGSKREEVFCYYDKEKLHEITQEKEKLKEEERQKEQALAMENKNVNKALAKKWLKYLIPIIVLILINALIPRSISYDNFNISSKYDVATSEVYLNSERVSAYRAWKDGKNVLVVFKLNDKALEGAEGTKDGEVYGSDLSYNYEVGRLKEEILNSALQINDQVEYYSTDDKIEDGYIYQEGKVDEDDDFHLPWKSKINVTSRVGVLVIGDGFEKQYNQIS